MEEAETEEPFSLTEEAMTRSQAGAGIETEDRSLRSDQAHARVPWSTRAESQLFTWQSGATGGRSSAEKKKEARQGNAPPT